MSLRNLRYFTVCLVNIEKWLQLDNQLPLIVGYFLAVKLLEAVNASSGDQTVQTVTLLKLSAISGLVTTHFDLHRNGWLALLANWDLLVLALNGSSRCSRPKGQLPAYFRYTAPC
jgi:hypothetical protein